MVVRVLLLLLCVLALVVAGQGHVLLVLFVLCVLELVVAGQVLVLAAVVH